MIEDLLTFKLHISNSALKLALFPGIQLSGILSKNKDLITKEQVKEQAHKPVPSHVHEGQFLVLLKVSS